MSFFTKLLVPAGFAFVVLLTSSLHAQRQMENLGRGVVAINQGEGKVFVSWRMLGTEPDGVAFNVYRATAGAPPTKINADPITKCTWYQDTGVALDKENAYFVRALINGIEQPMSKPFLNKIAANAPVRQYFSIPLQAGIAPSDGSVGDLDGDGEYDIVLKREDRGRDNSQNGVTGETHLEAYKMDGTFMWRINLGKNIRSGAHYTQFMVYDLDGDGKAEVMCKTADGAIDGTGKVIGDADKDWRNQNGMILQGPEFLTVFDGMTGKALSTIPFEPARGNPTDWGDNTGNRVDRFLGAVAYLDGQRPSVIMARGYYTGRAGGIGRNELAAYNWRDGKLSLVWHFKASRGPAGDMNTDYLGQGNHGISVADVEGNGKDVIIYGAMAINSDGTPRYSTHLGHGDAMSVSDIDPNRPGLEVWDIHENPRHPYGGEFRDASTGQMIWGKPGGTEASPDVGRGVAMDLDPRYPGYEMWCSGGATMRGLWNVKGEKISESNPRSCNFGCWWDGDLLREPEDANHIDKWDWEKNTDVRLFTAEGCTSNNGTKSTPTLCADILGDWREEVIWRTTDNKELRIYTTTIPTDHRLYTLMHDPQYRLSVAWQNVAYNQSTQPGFYLGEGMKAQPKPNITLVGASRPVAMR